jgi:hypothetical protein
MQTCSCYKEYIRNRRTVRRCVFYAVRIVCNYDIFPEHLVNIVLNNIFVITHYWNMCELINITITILDIIHRPVIYLKHNNIFVITHYWNTCELIIRPGAFRIFHLHLWLADVEDGESETKSVVVLLINHSQRSLLHLCANTPTLPHFDTQGGGQRVLEPLANVSYSRNITRWIYEYTNNTLWRLIHWVRKVTRRVNIQQVCNRFGPFRPANDYHFGNYFEYVTSGMRAKMLFAFFRWKYYFLKQVAFLRSIAAKRLNKL